MERFLSLLISVSDDGFLLPAQGTLQGHHGERRNRGDVHVVDPERVAEHIPGRRHHRRREQTKGGAPATGEQGKIEADDRNDRDRKAERAREEGELQDRGHEEYEYQRDESDDE